MALTLAAFCLVTFGADAAARITSLDLPLAEAAIAAVTHPAGGWPTLFLSVLPFAGTFEVAKAVIERKGRAWGVICLLLLTVMLWAVYFDGYLSYQHALRSQRWTDASLAVGLLFLKGFAVLLAPMAYLAWRRASKRPR